MKTIHSEFEVRAYSRPSKLRNKFLGVPLFAWVILLGASAIVSAAILSATVTKQQTVQSITLSFAASPNDISTLVAPGVPDLWTVLAVSSSGMISNVYLKTEVQGLTCGQIFATPSLLTFKEGTNSASVTLTPKDSAGVACASGGASNVWYFLATITENVDDIVPAEDYFFEHTWGSVPPLPSYTFAVTANN